MVADRLDSAAVTLDSNLAVRYRLPMWWMSVLACRAPSDPPTSTPDPVDEEAIARGWEVLRYGDFVGAGVPSELWFDFVAAAGSNPLNRTGPSAALERSYNLFAAPNGVDVVGGITCFGCHAAEIDGVFYPGIGDPRVDFSGDVGGSLFGLLRSAVASRYGTDSPEWEAFFPFARGGEAVSSAIVAPFAGVNPAFSLERAAVAHRDPVTLAWTDATWFEIPQATIWSDTPPWWHLQKRDTLYWTGFGRGDVRRLLMQISVVAITDVTQAEDILGDFDDVIAWIDALEPPPYPGAIDTDRAEAGAGLFVDHCARCHGTYGLDGEYPEVLVPADEVGTDPVYAEAFVGTPFVAWLNESWFASGGDGPEDPVSGYVAPPLDGIWATAPYLHNGSVPDLAALLDPAERPSRWRRDPADTSLDHERVGWPYTVPEVNDSWTYDTSVVGADSHGHDYAAALTRADRAALLEYLKTL